MEFFAHPWYMAFGGVLIAAPILIHLINRMRFKRIRWAAMEFLLKSQKRNRRRLIIEQLILLLLRILLVLLAAFLVARFLYGGTGPRGATHVLIVDDTLSMNDTGKNAGENVNAYGVAVEQVKKVARNAAKAASAQFMKVFLLSKADTDPIYDARLGDASEKDIEAAFSRESPLKRPTLLARSPLVGLQRGRKYFADLKGDTGQKVIHLVSDFREGDWTTGPDAQQLATEVEGALKEGINVNLIDVAAPYRLTNAKVANHHDNLALVELKAESRVAVEDAEVEFTATVMNYSQAAAGAVFDVYVNGEQDKAQTIPLGTIQPGSKFDHKFKLRFQSNKKGAEINPKDGPEERERKRRMEREYYHIRGVIHRQAGEGQTEDEALEADNIRDLVVEVRKKVPILVIDGNKVEGRGDGGDMHHLQAFYNASGIYEVEERRLQDLEKADLDLYPGIILMNVAELPAPAPDSKVDLVKKLQNYVTNGGSVMWFLGEETRSDHFNGTLFKANLFPVLLEDRPYDPFAAMGIADPEARKKAREDSRQKDPKPKMLFPDPTNVLAGRYGPALQSWFRYLSVNVYWKARARSQWDPEGRLTKSVIVLPNAESVDTFRPRALGLMQSVEASVNRLASREEEYKKYIPQIEDYRLRVRNALSVNDLYGMAQALDAMLNTPAKLNDKKEEERPSMPALWQHIDLKTLANDVKEFRERVLYGDPLLVSREVGKGRVLAMMTTAGTNLRKGVGEDAVQWNNWGSGDLVSTLYPLFLVDLHRYMISEGQAPNRVLGETVSFSVDAARYLPEVNYAFEVQPELAQVDARDRPKPEIEKTQMTRDGTQLMFALKDVRRPGIFRVTLTQQGEGDPVSRQEERAFAYNVEALEGDLKRATRDRLEGEQTVSKDPKHGKLTIKTPSDTFDQFQQKMPDASESPWLYLFFILILVVEQAMAVHLSFHLKGNENAPGTPQSTPAAAA